MGRSSPPPALVPPPTENRSSDLQLRKLIRLDDSDSSAVSPDTPESTPDSFRSLRSLDSSDAGCDSSNTYDQDLATPSSTIVEFDDAVKDIDSPTQPSMEAINDFPPFHRSRSRSGNSDFGNPSRASTPRPSARTPRSQIRSSSTPRPPREHSSSENVSRYLRSMARNPPADATKQLLQENTSLQQRISALQRTERELLSENHSLARQLDSLREHHEIRRKKMRDQHREREIFFQTRLSELEDRILQQERELQRYAQTSRQDKAEAAISDNEVIAWFTSRTVSWQNWADEFAHADPKRIKSLHPVQLNELCDSVKSFVRVSDDGLPRELVDPDQNEGVKPVHVMLHGMLANFIVTETLQSPFWMFNVLAAGGLDIESPSVMHADSPIGFRMDLALWSSGTPTLRGPSVLPPKAARLLHEPQSGRRLPPAATMPALSLNTTGVSSAPPKDSVPRKKDMECLYQLLSSIQRSDREMHSWRAQLIRTLSEGGLSLEPEKVEGEERRRLADARKTHAKNLKDRFLNGTARFLLRDQDAAGIEQLELRLVKEFDLALKFSCRVWSRPDALRIKGLGELSGTTFSRSSQIMDLCPGQGPMQMRKVEEVSSLDLPPAYHDRHGVVMAIQPAIESISADHEGNFEEARILSKARVLVAAPRAELSSLVSVSPHAATKSPLWAWSQGWAISPATGTVDGAGDYQKPDVAEILLPGGPVPADVA